MDYGKIAYLKAEELEARFSNILVRTDNLASDVTITPEHEFLNGELKIASLRANGGISLMVKILVEFTDKVSDVAIALSINGLESSHTVVSGDKGERVETLIVCGAYVKGNATLQLSSKSNQLVVKKVQSVVAGEDAYLSSVDTTIATDNIDDIWCLCTVENQSITAYVFTEDEPSLTPIFLGVGTYADVCAINGRFVVSTISLSGTVTLFFITTSGKVENIYYVSDGASCATITQDSENTFVLATLEGQKIILRDMLVSGCSEVAGTTMDNIGNVTQIRFVKKATRPTLCVFDDNGSHLRFASSEQVSTDAIKVTITASVTPL